jgi:hypothetical protein
MAVTSRDKRQDATAADLAEFRAALQAVARVTANVAAKKAIAPWNDFKQLLTGQYGVSFTDAETFMDILAGRKP